MAQEVPRAVAPKIQMPRTVAAFKLPIQGTVFAGLGGMRIKSPTLLRSATGQTDFDLNDRKKLKQSIIASLVLGPPRAYDTSFDNTIAK